MNQPLISQPHSLAQAIATLNHNLALIKPHNFETVQLITYTLMATAVVGLMVYHYIREQEQITN